MIKKKKYKYIALVPARSGSKTIKNKNLIKINGVSLIDYTLGHISQCQLISDAYISSDDSKILKFANRYGYKSILRPLKISNDTANLEVVISHLIQYLEKKNLEIENIILLQPTSPLRHKGDWYRAIKKFERLKLDSLFTSVNLHSLFWQKKNNKLKPINYSPNKRLNRQDMYETIIENGSFYIFNKEKFKKYNSRLFGKIGHYEMDKITVFEVDDKTDIKLMNKIIKNNTNFKWIYEKKK